MKFDSFSERNKEKNATHRHNTAERNCSMKIDIKILENKNRRENKDGAVFSLL